MNLDGIWRDKMSGEDAKMIGEKLSDERDLWKVKIYKISGK